MYNPHRNLYLKKIKNDSESNIHSTLIMGSLNDKLGESNIHSTLIMGSLNDKIGESWKINQMVGQKPSFQKIK